MPSRATRNSRRAPPREFRKALLHRASRGPVPTAIHQIGESPSANNDRQSPAPDIKDSGPVEMDIVLVFGIRCA